MRLILSFGALFLSAILLQLGAGGLGPLDALSGLQAGFSRGEVGLLGSAHFFGFFIGCWWAPRLIGAVGHSRAFAVFVSMGTIGIIAHTLTADALAWSLFRVLSGLCIAGSYTVIEGWLQAKVTNENRGRAMGLYRVVDIVGSLGAQLMIAVLEPGAYVSYNLLAILSCLAMLPLVMTRITPPKMPKAPRLRAALAWRRSPLAVAGVIAAGVTTASFRMVGAIYGVEVGLTADQIALFLSVFVAGGALAQYPAGWLADRFDRRWVLIWISAAAIVACAVMVRFTGSTGQIMWASALFGFVTFPVYSIAAAHAHDFASDDERVELSAALVFLYAIGAIASPYLGSGLMELFGSSAMFVMISVAHVALIGFGLMRMRVRPTQSERTRYVYAPRTSFTVGRLFARFRNGRGPEP